MRTDVLNDVRELFFAALDYKTPTDLDRFLDTECAAQPALRRRIEVLLNAHRDSGSFMGGVDAPDPYPEPLLKPGSTIDRFRILGLLGEGGFGVVYLAEQFEPVVRQVAFKVIKPGMDTQQLIARFQAERQALALMDHPHIAHVYDGGETPCGHPYVVMELVAGLPITEYCDARRMPIRERLRLCVDVCRAVQHAHQKGLIHCDLKPSNVLVTTRDDQPVVKVIDFGIAKVFKAPVSEGTESAAIAAFLGSPNYMSPEQWPLSGLDVDTRSDVYSLGVLLYQLLTGTTPFHRKDWATMKWDELYRSVRDATPPKPSQRMGPELPESTAQAEARAMDPLRLSRLLHGELDWIVLKALDADRRRRYDSAGGLADDLERHLNHGLVHAAPPSRLYWLSKLVQRHRAVAAMVGVVLVCLITTTLISVGAAIRAERATAAAQTEQKNTERQWQRAETNLQQARTMVDRVLVHLERAEAASEGNIEQVRHAILRDALDFFQAFLQANASDPRLQSDMAETLLQIADAHAGLREWGKAEDACRSAIAILADLRRQHPQSANYVEQHAAAQLTLATTLRESRQKLGEAESLYREGLATYERLALAGEPSEPDLPILIERLESFGHFLGFSLGRRNEAEPYLQRAVALGRTLACDDQPGNLVRLAQVCNTLGILYRQSLTPFRAPALHRESIDLLQQALASGYRGDLRGELARSYSHLGLAQVATGDFAGAERELVRAVALRRAMVVEFPKNHNLRVELALNELQRSGILQSLGRVDEAEVELRQSATRFRELAGAAPHDASVGHFALDVTRRLGDLLVARGQAAAAGELYDTLATWQGDSAASADAMAWHLANCPLIERRDPPQAIKLAKSAVAGNAAEGSYWCTLGCAQWRAGDPLGALESLTTAQQLVADRGDTLPGFLLAFVYRDLGNDDRARAELMQAQSRFIERPTWMPEDDALAAEAGERLAPGGGNHSDSGGSTASR